MSTLFNLLVNPLVNLLVNPLVNSWVNPLEFDMREYAVLIPLPFCLIAMFYYGLATYAAIDFLAQPIHIDPDFHPPVSILKPLCGLDVQTYDNLASFCRQNYPIYQIIFSVQDPHDPVIDVVKQIQHDFPTADICLVIDDRAIGINLKISNLANAVSSAKYSILLISDSDIRVDSTYLMTVVQPLTNSAVGVVTCMYRSQVQGGIAAFEALGIATELAPTTLVSRKLEGMTFGIGATIVIRNSVLEAFGGFPAVANYLHDDFHLGRMPSQLGYQVVLSPYVVSHELATETLFDFVQHQTRWNRGIRLSQPLGYAGQLFTFGTIASLLLLLTTQGSFLAWSVLSVTWLLRWVMAWTVGVRVLNDPIVKRLFWLVPVSDVVRFGMWCYGFVGDRIEWRGRQFNLRQTGLLKGSDEPTT